MTRQTSFGSGELAPTLHGRTDAPFYPHGARRLRNFFVNAHGSAVSRASTLHCGPAGKGGPGVRLVPFIYSDVQNYVLEFGHGYVRFWQAGQLVMAADASGPLEVATGYPVESLSSLKYTQSGDVLTLCCAGQPARELRRYAHQDWRFASLVFDVPASYFPEDPPRLRELVERTAPDAAHPLKPWQWQVTSICQTPDGRTWEGTPFTVTETLALGYEQWNAATNYEVGTRVSVGFVTGEYWECTTANLNKHPQAEGFEAYWFGPIATSPPHRIIYPAPLNLVLYPDKPVTLEWKQPGLVPDPGFRTLAYLVYRGRDGLFGYVGETKTKEFRDEGQAPDFLRGPPRGENPFQVFDFAGTLLRTEQPRTVAYFEERLVFGGTGERPSLLLGSATGDYLNFDSRTPAPADGPVTFEIASRRREEVRWLVGRNSLLVGTSVGVWAVDGGGGPLAPGAAVAHPQSEVGTAWLEPIAVGDDLLYVRTKGAGVRALRYSESSASFAGVDLSILSSHLLEGYSVVDWCYQEDPDSIVWAVRSDGALLSLTYQPEHEVAAWALHQVNGLVSGICSIPEGEEDAVYLSVARAGGIFLERFDSRRLPLTLDAKGDLVPDPVRCFALDSAVTDEVELPPDVEDYPSRLVSVPHLVGQEVYVVADGSVLGPYTPDAEGALVLEGYPRVAHIGVRFTPELETLDVPTSSAKDRSRPKAVSRVTVDLFQSRGLFAGEVLTGRGIKVGEDRNSLKAWQQRQVSDGFGPIPYATGTATIEISSTWNAGGRVLLRQMEPLPLTILGLNREVDLGGP